MRESTARIGRVKNLVTAGDILNYNWNRMSELTAIRGNRSPKVREELSFRIAVQNCYAMNPGCMNKKLLFMMKTYGLSEALREKEGPVQTRLVEA